MISKVARPAVPTRLILTAHVNVLIDVPNFQLHCLKADVYKESNGLNY